MVTGHILYSERTITRIEGKTLVVEKKNGKFHNVISVGSCTQ